MFCYLLCLCCMVGMRAASNKVQRQLVNLRTNYMKNPLGIEETPQFSWEMQADGVYGAAQKAYRLTVAKSVQDLKQGKYVYDTGKCKDDTSVGITYKGSALQPCTRYFWQVEVWDEKGKLIQSSQDNWFETALMDAGWDGAQWIGSDNYYLNKYSQKFLVGYDFKIANNSQRATFVFGATHEKTCTKMEVDVTNPQKAVLRLGHDYKGEYTEDYVIDISSVIGASEVYKKHHLEANVVSSYKHCNGYEVAITIDGNAVGQSKSYKVKLQDNNPKFKSARLYNIGFQQAVGQQTVFSNIFIDEPYYHKRLYSNNMTYDIKGDGKYKMLNPTEKRGAPMLRKLFVVNKHLKSARLYATARGIYEMCINGKAVAEDFFNPGWTDFRYRQQYNVFDVTNLMLEGKNVMGATLGAGWYSGAWGYNSKWYNGYGVDISFLGKLVLTYYDGTQECVVTDGSWVYTEDGPVRENGWQEGEYYDANKEIAHWCEPTFKAEGWKPVKIYDPLKSNVQMTAYIGQPVRIDEICTAQKQTSPLPNVYIYDMGQNMVGVPRIQVNAPKGTVFKITFAEMLYPEIIPEEPVAPYTKEMYEQQKGQMYLDNYRSAITTDYYICKGDPKGETIEPHFTSHGFRYIQIESENKPAYANIPTKDVQVLVLNSLQEITASFETDNANINKLYSNIVWGQKGNFLAVPTDCPQRDERLGWTGDAQIFTRTATYNRNVQPFYNRWLYTLRDDQSPKGEYVRFAPLATSITQPEYYQGVCPWSEVGIITPWELYMQYGDKAILERSYASQQRYMDYMASRAPEYLQPIGGYGDWVALLGTPSDLTSTAYYAWDALLMSKIAHVIGKEADAQKYSALYENIKQAFCKRYLREDGWMKWNAGSPALRDSYSAAYGTGPKTTQDTILDTQTAHILPLYVGILDGKARKQVAARLVELLKRNDYKLNTGFIGTPYMNLVLSENGYDDVAYKMFQQEEYPSWIYPLLQGATTIWERWNSYTIKNGFGPVGMNSFNHYGYGAIQDWMFAYSAGIQRDEAAPAYKHILLQPRIGGTLQYVCAKYHTVYGEVCSHWESHKPQTDKQSDAAKYGYTYIATVPANTTATLTLPVGTKTVQVKEGKQGIVKIKHTINEFSTQQQVAYTLKAGNYVFVVD